MGSGETFHQIEGEVVLTTHENVLPWDEYIFKYHQCLTAHNTVFRVALVYGTATTLSVIAVLATKNVNQTGSIYRNIEANRIVGVRLFHRSGGHYQVTMGIYCTSNMNIGSSDHNAIPIPFHNADILVRVGLLTG